MLAVQINQVSKEYRLGAIGSTTLFKDLQSRWARLRGREDPNVKIGVSAKNYGEKFLALNDVSFSIEQGEIVGIIGANGAGKSTLLKLLAQVTAPTSGEILLNGRIASMLEVGTGFHPEMTGRENVYMNGAILGMTKEEIAAKFDSIVEFSGLSQFIDTPVKRYSSGMYVKLAFAVAAHLDSEIMIMDEVLAVGDMRFQQKCLSKMGDVSNREGRTVLYVSHNMNTIRALCQRCLVLEQGRLVFDGGVNEAIQCYLGNLKTEELYVDVSQVPRASRCSLMVKLLSTEILYRETSVVEYTDKLYVRIRWYAQERMEHLKLRFFVMTDRNTVPVGVAFVGEHCCDRGENEASVSIDTAFLALGIYSLTAVFYEANDFGTEARHDRVANAISFEVVNGKRNDLFSTWDDGWGKAVFTDMSTFVEDSKA